MFNSKISLGSTGFHRHTKMSAPKNFNAELILSFVVVCIIIGHTTLFYQRTVNNMERNSNEAIATVCM